MPGDANGDGKVDVGDLGILAANYGLTAEATWAMGDFNEDGGVDVGDLGILAANYGVGTGVDRSFAEEAAARGLWTKTAEETPATFNPGCGLPGLPLIAGLFLIGVFSIRRDEA